MFGTARNAQFSVHITGKRNKFVGDKDIGYMQREVFQRRIYFQAILTRRSREQLTVCYQYFYFIMIQISVQILLSLLTR